VTDDYTGLTDNFMATDYADQRGLKVKIILLRSGGLGGL